MQKDDINIPAPDAKIVDLALVFGAGELKVEAARRRRWSLA